MGPVFLHAQGFAMICGLSLKFVFRAELRLLYEKQCNIFIYTQSHMSNHISSDQKGVIQRVSPGQRQ